ncbi:MAG: F0F1 ATP synthase subunit delta [Gammaproteobacteria bacterium]|nr:F0F1 ATP synthase subunit delta [Gammaproteobacteria bacterium]
MADYTTVARPYARAVYQQATETSSVDSWGQALALMTAVANDAQMQALLDSPQLGHEQKAELMLKVLADKLTPQQQNLVKLIAENDRLKILPEIAEQYEAFRAEAEGKIDAEVISAFPLSKEQEATIVAMLKEKLHREVSISSTIDASLIGGVVIKAGDTIIDGSMKSQLKSLALALGR